MMEIAARYLQAEVGVRYWEDATVNGVEDVNGDLIPCRKGDCWSPVIDLATGVIEGWPEGVVADVHYKVCDAGRYTLLDAERKPVATRDDYVPKIMCPGGDGYGDYVIMSIDGTGKIADWRCDLAQFSREETVAFVHPPKAGAVASASGSGGGSSSAYSSP